MDIDFGIFFMVMGANLLTALALRNATRGMATKIGRNPQFYPSHYAAVPKKMKKIFGVRQNFIPKYLIFQYYITVVHFYVGVFELLLYYCAKDNGLLASYLFFMHYFFLLVHLVIFVIVSAIFKKQ